MRRRLVPVLIAAVPGLMAAAPAASAGAGGTVELIQDGIAEIWPIADHDAEFPDPNLHFRDFGFVWQASLVALGPVPEADPATEDADDFTPGPSLIITFSGVNGDIAATEASIVLTTAPEGRRYVSAEGEPDLVQVEALDLTEDMAVTTGRFDAVLCARERVFAAPDPDDCVNVSGRFSARLPRDDG